MSTFTDQMYASAASSTRGLVTGPWDAPVRRSWSEVHMQARRMAGALANAGIGPGSVVAVLGGDPADVAPLAQAVWMRGASLTMLQQPTPRTDLAVWLADTVRASNTIGAVLTVVGSPFGVAEEPLAAAGQRVVTIDALRTGADIDPLHVDDSAVAMYQLTSGSTGTPKAVQLTHENLLANSVALFTATDGDASTDVMVSWLPLSHDMGMLAFLTHPMQWGVELIAATPEEFLRRPALWPDLITRYRGAITSGPNFAYAVLALTLERAEPGQYDLSSLRVAINGAEPIDARDVHRLAEAGARFGLRPGAITSAYGMAEATLAVTFDRSRHINVDRISRRDLHERGVATPDAAEDARSVVSVGLPVAGMEVRVVDDHGRQATPRQVGSIAIRGAAVSRGYLTENGWLDGDFQDGWLSTGDLGYLDADGKLYVCGRAKDVIVIAGNNVYPTDIERAACTVPGVRAGNAVAVRIDAGDSRESFAVLAESKQADDPAEAERIRAEIALRVSKAVGYNARAVLVLPPGSVPKTGSGKLQRGKAAELFARFEGQANDYTSRKEARA
ncbi:fatty acyl-AMP ligase [Mycobacterium sp. 2YAF39]|uniref:fatty acyl-AMP ligase n=1 Tax=Mycobacterium sp. 2YAF39 TaxID=3233033 RepID=UPI003F9E3779